MATVREMVKAMQTEMRGELTPIRACELLAHSTALIGNCNAAIRVADKDYAVVLLGCLNGEEAANRAKIRAEITPEFEKKREARDVKEEVEQLIGSLKYILRNQQEEMKLSR